MFDNYLYSQTNGFNFILKKGDDLTTRIGIKKSFEPHVTNIFKALVNEGDSVIDLGANLGYHTLELSRLVGPGGYVLSVEPLKETYLQLCSNLLANDAFNVEPLRKICTSTNDSFVMRDIEKGNIGNTRVGAKSSDHRVSVPSFTLDQLEFNCSLVKMDVQGSEVEVLKGAKTFIKNNRPIFVVEIEEHHLNEFKTTSKDLLNFFIDMDYVVYRIMTEYPCDHVAVPREKDTFDFEQITGYNTKRIEQHIKSTTLKWPLYDETF